MASRIPRLTKAKYVEGYEIWLEFQDGKSGTVDFRNELWGPVFEPLQDLESFKQFRVCPELETLVWPSGADFAPDFLYEQAVATAQSA